MADPLGRTGYKGALGPSERKRRQVAAVLDRMSPANRPFAATFLRDQENRRSKIATVARYAEALGKLDQHLAGRPFASATEADCRAFVASLSGLKVTSASGIVALLRKSLRDLLAVDNLPRAMDKALYVRNPPRDGSGRVITDDEFNRLLGAASSLATGRTTLPMADKSQAILWTLRDAGYRASEMLSLNVGDLVFDGPRGLRLNLRKSAPDLKTGPRPIYVVRAAGPLRAWLNLHPLGTDPRAPVFTGWYDRTGTRRLAYQDLYRHIKMLGKASGVITGRDRSVNLCPHDFRHTRATEAARDNWNEEKMRCYFGWKPGSRMPSLYTHLALGDLREQVRRDAGLDDHGCVQPTETVTAAQLMEQAMRLMLSQQQTTKIGFQNATPRPPEWE